MDTVDSNTCAIDSFCDPLYSQSLCMGKTIIICYSIWYVLCTDCHVVWCLYTIGVCWCCFWSSSSYDGSSCTNTSDPTSNPWSALVLGIAYQHACWWIDAFCRHLYRAFLHLQVHLEWSVLLHVWLFDTRIPNPGGDNCGNCYCHYLFQFMQRGKFDQGSCHDNPYLYHSGLSMVVEILCSFFCFRCLCILVSVDGHWYGRIDSPCVCRYSIFYYFTRLKVTGFVPAIVYFGHSLMICIVYGLCMGTIGFFATFLFIRKIYAAIKVCDAWWLVCYCFIHTVLLDRQL